MAERGTWKFRNGKLVTAEEAAEIDRKERERIRKEREERMAEITK
jgi:hypothetical protein